MKYRLISIVSVLFALLYIPSCNGSILNPDGDEKQADSDYYARYVATPLDGTDVNAFYDFKVSLPNGEGLFSSKGGFDEVLGPFKKGQHVWIYLNNYLSTNPKFIVKVYVKKGSNGPFCLFDTGYDTARSTI